MNRILLRIAVAALALVVAVQANALTRIRSNRKSVV